AAHRVRRPAGDVVPAEQDTPAGGRGAAGDDVDQRRLSGAVRADHAEEVAGREGETDALQHPQPAEALGEVLDAQLLDARDGTGGGGIHWLRLPRAPPRAPPLPPAGPPPAARAAAARASPPRRRCRPARPA